MTAPGERRLGWVGRGALAAVLASGFLASLVGDDPTGIALYVAFAGTGAFLAFRRPATSIGWLLMTTGWGLAIGSVRAVAAPADLATIRTALVATAGDAVRPVNSTVWLRVEPGSGR